jgi:hypothetical protein
VKNTAKISVLSDYERIYLVPEIGLDYKRTLFKAPGVALTFGQIISVGTRRPANDPRSSPHLGGYQQAPTCLQLYPALAKHPESNPAAHSSQEAC